MMLARYFFFQLGNHILQYLLSLLVSWYFDEDFDLIFSDIYNTLMCTAIEATIDWIIGRNSLVFNGCDLFRFFSLYQEVTESEGMVDRLEIVEQTIKSNPNQKLDYN